MNKDHKWLVAATIMLLLLASSAQGIGETGAQFLKIGVGARACAMGEAFAALADDPSAVYWNPAGLTQIETTQLLGSQNFWLLDMSYQYVAATIPTRKGSFGGALAFSSSGDIPKYENFEKTGEYSAFDFAGTAAYGTNLGSNLAMGIGLKVIHQKIEEESALGYAVDVGVMYEISGLAGVSLGGAVQNIGPGVKFIEEADPLPLNFKGGVAYRTGQVVLAADLNKDRDSDIRGNFGGEYTIKQVLALRAGYNTSQSFSAGVGVFWHRLSFGYAFVPNGDVGDSNRLTLTVVL